MNVLEISLFVGFVVTGVLLYGIGILILWGISKMWFRQEMPKAAVFNIVVGLLIVVAGASALYLVCFRDFQELLN